MFDVTAAIYICVSTEEQTEGWSLEAQRCLCQALAQSRGWSVYTDSPLIPSTVPDIDKQLGFSLDFAPGEPE